MNNTILGYLILHPYTQENPRFQTLVLNRLFDIKPDQRIGIIRGNTQLGVSNIERLDYSPAPAPFKQVWGAFGLAHIESKGEEPPQPYAIPVPSRNCCIATVMSGTILNAEEISEFTGIDSEGHCAGHSPAKLMVRLNSTKHSEIVQEANATEGERYAKLVKERVIHKMRGKWSMVIAYLSAKPRIILSSKYSELYLWIIKFENVYALFWSNDAHLPRRLASLIPKEFEHNLFIHQIPIPDPELMVIHPLYLLTKFKKWHRKNVDSTESTSTLAAVERYLRRTSTED